MDKSYVLQYLFAEILFFIQLSPKAYFKITNKTSMTQTCTYTSRVCQYHAAKKSCHTTKVKHIFHMY